jgi:hypothetical protein
VRVSNGQVRNESRGAGAPKSARLPKLISHRSLGGIIAGACHTPGSQQFPGELPMPHRFIRVRSICQTLCLLLLLAAFQLKAQVATADVLGTVLDNSGAVIVNATVTVQNLSTRDTRSGLTNASGEYVFTLLPIGTYSVRIEAPGFKTFLVSDLSLSSGDRARVDGRLEIGQMAESIIVEGVAPALQSDSSTVGTVVSQQAVQDLPMNGRNFIAVVRLAPGASEGSSTALDSGNRPDDRRPGSTLVVGSGIKNSFLVDAMDNNDRLIGTVLIKPSLEALSEIRVQTSLYTAEVGRTAGGVVNVLTKSGSNALHGALFEYFRNDRMDASDFFALPGTKPPFRQNQYGGNLGGAIVKNKTFFFGDYEGTRRALGELFHVTVPTDAMKAGNFAGVAAIYDPLSTRSDPNKAGAYIRDRFPNDLIPASRLNPIAVEYMGLYPEPQNSSLVGNFTSAPMRTQNSSTFDSRIDHYFREHDLMYGRYYFNDTTSFVPGSLPSVNGIDPGGNFNEFPGPALQRAQGALLNYLHIFSPTLLLEVKAGWARYANHAWPLNQGKSLSQEFGIVGANIDEDSSGLTNFQPSGYEQVGGTSSLPLIQIDNVCQYLGALTYTRSSHSIKIGAGLVRRQATIVGNGWPRGSWITDANASNNAAGSGGNSIASFLLGFPANGQRTENFTWPGMRIWEPSVYVQDDWRVNRRLTLNIGVRYDVFTPYVEVANRISNFDVTTAKIIIAGQNGVSRSAGIRTDYSNVAPRFGFALTLGQGTVLRGGYGISFVPTNAASGSYLKNPPFISTFAFTNDTIFPAYNISQGFPPAVPVDPNNLTGNLSATAGNFRSTYSQQFNLTLQRDFSGNVVSLGYLGQLTRHNDLNYNLDQPLPAAGAVQQRRPYYALYPNLNSVGYDDTIGTANYHSLQAIFERRLKAGLTVNANYVFAKSLSWTAGGQLMDNWHINYGPDAANIRHRWTLQLNYQLPFGRTFSGIAKAVASGWQFNAIGVYSTGSPITVTNGSSRINTGAGDRPNRVGSGDLSNPSLTKWFDTSAFVAQPLYTAGNSGVGILSGPPFRHLDLSLFKRFPVKERFAVDFRVETFNITNTPSFALPGSALGTSSFGVITSTNGNYTPRQIQLALRVSF